MPKHITDRYLSSARRWFGASDSKTLDAAQRKVLDYASRGSALTEDPIVKLARKARFGERLADAVARFGGSWTFIMIFVAILLTWTLLNTEILGKTAFDPFPYIFLNLMLSMVAALQAPVIMMSQNRQSTKDRHMAAHDYEINLKAEIEILALHEKIDALRQDQLMTLLAQQQAQIDLLQRLLTRYEADELKAR